MSFRINDYDISNIKINNSNIKLGKIDGIIVFQLNDKATITIVFSEKDITVRSTKTGKYDFYYTTEDDVIIQSYDKIMSLDLKKNIPQTYTYLNTFNIAPYEAKKMVVCEEGTLDILASASLPSQFLFDNVTYGNKLYSFGALSDVHIDGDGTDEASAAGDLVRALQFFNSNASLVGISGDLTIQGGYSELSIFKELVDNNATIPVYASRGNHDCRYSLEDFIAYTGGNLYFEQSYQNDKFIFLGMNQENYGDNCFTAAELD